MAQYEELTVGKLKVTGNAGTDSVAGTLEAVSGLSVVHKQVGMFVQSTFTLSAISQALDNTNQYIGTKLFTFPKGRILVLGTVATLAETTATAILGTLNGGKTGAVSLGSATASSTTLSTTMVNVLPSTAWVSSTVIDVAGTAVSGALAASAQIDGTTTAVPLYLNSAVVTDGDLDADAVIKWSGSITITWANLGTY